MATTFANDNAGSVDSIDKTTSATDFSLQLFSLPEELLQIIFCSLCSLLDIARFDSVINNFTCLRCSFSDLFLKCRPSAIEDTENSICNSCLKTLLWRIQWKLIEEECCLT